jgi:TPR repeat protein
MDVNPTRSDRPHVCARRTALKPIVRESLLACVLVIAVSASAGPLEDGMEAYRAQEYAKAAELWGPAAEKGDPAAQYYLGSLLAEGKGLTHDDAAAFRWFMRAASQGHAGAQYNVGASYASGTGVGKSYEEAAKWFRRAADQGMVFAQVNLGLLYAGGNGVPQDNIEALKWLELAFKKLPAGGEAMDVAHAMQDVTAKMNRDQIDEARLRERQWKPQPETK